MDRMIVKMEDVEILCHRIADKLMVTSPKGHFIFGVPRGGLIPAQLVARAILQKGGDARVVYQALNASVIVDDIIDSGSTLSQYLYYPVPFYACYTKRKADIEEGRAMALGNSWVIFPWEESALGSAVDIVKRFLQFIGEDPSRGGLQETPERVVKAWEEWFNGYRQAPSEVLKTFEDGADKVNEMVVVRDIPVYSHCEHHLAPFFGVAHIAYIPNGKIVGLSKLSRVVDILARRLQVQERLTNQIADSINECLSPVGVGVVIECRHMCMESSGINRAGVTTLTSALRGALMEQPSARAEFFSLVRQK